MSFLSDLHKTDLVKAPRVIMLRLFTADLSGASPAQIATSAGLSKSTVSMALDQLERDGIIERRIPARDQRQQTIYLTPHGRRKTKRMLNAMIAYVDDVKNRGSRVRP